MTAEAQTPFEAGEEAPEAPLLFAKRGAEEAAGRGRLKEFPPPGRGNPPGPLTGPFFGTSKPTSEVRREAGGTRRVHLPGDAGSNRSGTSSKPKTFFRGRKEGLSPRLFFLIFPPPPKPIFALAAKPGEGVHFGGKAPATRELGGRISLRRGRTP